LFEIHDILDPLLGVDDEADAERSPRRRRLSGIMLVPPAHAVQPSAVPCGDLCPR
jgi:hypothetical protein